MLRRLTLACALLLLPCVADAAPKKLSEMLITLDPTTDIESTMPGWAAQNFSASGCEMQPKLANKAPLKSPPFTRDEVIDLAKKTKRLRQTTKDGKTFLFVAMKAASGASPKLIAVDEYVNQLNAVEGFLNIYGRSLREKNPKLGVVARLRPKVAPCHPKAPDFIPIKDPRIFNPSDPMRQIVNPGDIFISQRMARQGGPLFRVVFDNSPVTDRTEARVRQAIQEWQSSRTPAWILPAFFLLRQGYNGNTHPGGVAGAHSTLSSRLLYGDHWALRNYRRAGDHMQLPVGKSGPVVTLSGDAGCLGGPDEGGKCPDGKPIAENNFDCPGAATCGVCVSTSSHKCPPPDPSNCEPGTSGPGGSSHGGGVNFVDGEPSKNLCDGTLGASMDAWSGCIGSNGLLGGWFGGQSCVAIASTNIGHDGVFSFDDSVSLESGMKFFGVDLDFLTASAEAKFDSSAGGPSVSGPTLSGMLAALGSNGVCCDPIAGPSTLIMVGPYPLYIYSQMNIALNGKDLKPSASPLPGDCNSGPGKVLEIAGKASAKVSAQLTAEITIEIVKAGLVGTLDMVNDEIHGTINTVVDQGHNALTFTPAMGYTSARAGGNVSAFFTVDVFVTDYTFSLSLATWDGFTESQDFPHDPAVGHAVKPAHLVCKAPGG